MGRDFSEDDPKIGYRFSKRKMLRSARPEEAEGLPAKTPIRIAVCGEPEGCYPLEQQHDHHGPELLIESASSCGADQPGWWLMSWRVQNVGQEPIEILSIWLPHDKFSSGQQVFDSPIRLMPNESRLLEVRVACLEAPGSVVDNAFVILRLRWMGQPWRALARQRVTIDAVGVPRHCCEVISAHPIGFSV